MFDGTDDDGSLEDLERELAECEQELVLWKLRRSRALKKRALEALPSPSPDASPVAELPMEPRTETSLQAIASSPVRSHSPQSSSPSAHLVPVQSPLPAPIASPSQAEPTTVRSELPLAPVASPEPSASPTMSSHLTISTTTSASATPQRLTSPLGPLPDEASQEDRRLLVQKLREEKAKVARREKIAELEKAAAEALKKQRIAREKLERVNLQRAAAPPPIRTTHTNKRPLPVSATPPRHAKRQVMPTDKPLDPEALALPKAVALPLASPGDLLSHVFRVCTRSLMQSNKSLSVPQLQVLCQEYFGKEFGLVAQACGVASADLGQLLSPYAYFRVAVTGLSAPSSPVDAPSNEWLIPSLRCDSADALAAFLHASREGVLGVLQLTSVLASKESALLDVVKAHAMLHAAAPRRTFLELCWPRASEVTMPALSNGLVFLHLLERSEATRGGSAAAATSSTHPTTPFPLRDASPLVSLRSFRFTPAFATLYPTTSVLSNAFAHRIDPNKVLCPFELHGVCNDDQCNYQHERDYAVSSSTALQDLGRLHPLPETDASASAESIAAAWVSTVQAASAAASDVLFLRGSKAPTKASGAHQAWMDFTQSLVSLRKMEYDLGLGYLDEDELPMPSPSPMTPRPHQQTSLRDADQDMEVDDDEDFLALPPAEPVAVLSGQRYHAKEYLQHAIHDLERQVALNPEDADAWVSLALMHLDMELPPHLDDVGVVSSDAHLRHVLQALRSRFHAASKEKEDLALEKTLHVLSRALEIEANVYNKTLWRLYLALYPDDATRQELAQEALRFLPASRSLWLTFLDRGRFESVGVAQVLYYRSIEKLLRHGDPDTSSAIVYALVLRLVALYVGAGQIAAAYSLLLSLLVPEKADAKPLCFASFEFHVAEYCQLWLLLVHLDAFGRLPDNVLEKATALDWVVVRCAERLASDAMLALAVANMPQDASLFNAVLLLNYLVLWPAARADVLPKLVDALSMASVADDDVVTLLHHAHTIVGGDAALPTPASDSPAHLVYSKNVSSLYPRGAVDAPDVWADKQLLSWADAFIDGEGSVFTGLALLEFIAAVAGSPVASRQLDWLLQRPRFKSSVHVRAQQTLWCYRLHLEDALDAVEAVWKRYLAFAADDAMPVASVRAAVDWCLSPPTHSAALKFGVFQVLLRALPSSMHAALFARYLYVLGGHPPYLLAFASTSLTDRHRSSLKHAVRACLENTHVGDADLVGLAVRLELLVAPTRASMLRVQSLLRSSVRRNPVSAAPWQLALSLELALGKQKAYADAASFLAPTWVECGVNVSAMNRSHAAWATASAIDVSSQRLVLLPPSLLMLAHLAELDLSRNCLLELPEALGRSFPQLRTLNVSCNALRRLPDAIGHLKSLEVLDVGHNHLTELPLLLSHLTKLTALDVSYNLLATVPMTLRGLKQLRHLRVAGNIAAVDAWRRVVPGAGLDGGSSCSLCQDGRHTQRLNGVLLCPRCIIQAMAPLL
ncbi:hypothetical protein SDRG_06738 [Saprolegnia diclina VS20]|uniref:C3H1-type domain-containing protein n=1 Tax=Saprolegnia diclina (strain VS20) TaxID=1156394 RepID=T0RUC2_SAPDV|nr:hypothetical protein SDRG_06738 [Saprolegnia diclina VS20]EQC35998.1 hypothetical protein SDRG_06738 [Saprolegnia diclina VS20]|eukprot:XP_008610760.1 hypothetical protein SDRG_06738 [Saprolegnia diclina VS20]